MAQRVQTVLTDDLDGSTEDVDTYTFAVQGTAYEVELSKKNAQALFKALMPYTEVARKVSGGRGRGRGRSAASNGVKRTDLAEIREWARKNGREVSDRGRLPAEVIEAYDAAQK